MQKGVRAVAGYITLVKFTSQGAANIKESPKRIAEGKALAEKLGIKTVGVWATMGEYDMVLIGDAPDDLTVATFSIALSSLGNVTTQTMRALSEQEFGQVLSRLP